MRRSSLRRHYQLGRINDRPTYCRTRQYLLRPPKRAFPCTHLQKYDRSAVASMSHHGPRLSSILQGKDMADVPHGDEPPYHCGGVQRCDQGQNVVAISGMQDMPPGQTIGAGAVSIRLANFEFDSPSGCAICSVFLSGCMASFMERPHHLRTRS